MTGSSKSPPKEVMVNPSIIRKIPVTNEQSNQFTKNNFTNDNDNNKYDKNNNETIIKNDNIMATTMNDRQQFSSASSIKQQQQHNFGLDHTTIRHKTNNIPSFFMIRYISSMIPIICKSCIFVSISLYLLNQKHLLPKPLSRIVSNVMFWPTIPITMINRNILNEHKWITTIDDTVIMGGAPFGFMNFPKLLYQTYGVRGVINLCEEYKGPIKQYNDLGIVSLYLPTVDHCEPSLADLELALDFIQQFNITNQKIMKSSNNDRNHKVYIHCRAGHGRSAAVVMAYLISKVDDPMNINLKDINEHLVSLRNVRKTLWQQPNIKRLAQRLKDQHQRKQQEDQTIDMIVSDWDRVSEEDDADENDLK